MLSNIKRLVTGAGLGKLIALASLPAITRLYSPDQFGTYNVIYAIAIIVSPLLTLRYAACTPLPTRDTTAAAIVRISFSIATFSAAGLFLSALVFWESITSLLSIPNEVILLFYAAIISFTWCSYEILTFWATRKGYYSSISHSTIAQGLVGSAVKILAPTIALHGGLYAGQTASHIAGSVALIKKTLLDRDIFRRSRKISSIKILKLYSEFPKYRLPSQILLSIATYCPILITSAYYSSESAGLLALAITTLMAPVSLIGNAVGQVYYGEAAKYGRKNISKLKSQISKISIRIASTALIPTLVIFFFGEKIYSIAFGSQWSDAGHYAQILSIYLIPQLIANPLMNILNVLREQKAFLAINTVRTATTTLALIVPTSYGCSLTTATTTFSITLALNYATTISYILKKVGKS